MQSTKFYRIAAKLSRQELGEFKDFIDSPYHNKHRILVRFWAAFEKHLLAYPGQNMDKANFYKILYPDRKYAPRNLASLLNKATSLFWDFIATQESLRDSLTRQKYLLSGLNRKQWSKDDDAKPFADAGKTLNTHPTHDAKFFQQRLDMESEWYRFENRQTKGTQRVSLQPLLTSIDSYFMIRSLEFACAAANVDNIYGSQHSLPPSIRAVIRLMEKGQKDVPPLARIYYYCYKTLVHKDEERENAFFTLKRLLFKHAANYSRNEALDLYTYAVNFCTRQINSGNGLYLVHAYELYQHLLDDFLADGEARLSAGFFKNIFLVMASLAKKADKADFSGAENFLERYKNRLIKDNEGVAYLMCKGVLYFFQEEYRKAESQFHQVLNDAEDVFYKLEARAYLWKCYYELGDLRAFDAAYNSLRMAVKRAREISAHHREKYHLFIKFFQAFTTIQRKKIEKLLETKEQSEKRKAKLLRLKAQIENEEMNVNLNWLLDKVDSGLGKKVLS